MPTWTTAFTTPPATTGLVATPDPSASSMVLAWDASTITAAEFWRYAVYRKNSNGVYDQIGEVFSRGTGVVGSGTEPTFTDREAPHGIAAQYAVTTDNGWAEGEASAASAVLSLRWWLVHPTDQSLTTELRIVTGMSEAHEVPQQRLQPLGRSSTLVVSRARLAPTGQLQLTILPAEAALFPVLLRAAEVDPYVVLKSPFGDVYRVRLGSIERGTGPIGTRPVTIAYTAVA